MTPEHRQPAAPDAPFDIVAREYDAAFTDTPIGRLLRDRVWVLLSRQMATTRRTTALELNCGTGEDAVWLAGQGWRVLATDISAEMVAATKAKAKKAGLEAMIRAEVCSIADIARLTPGALEPGLICSNFGGLNCLSPAEIKNLGIDLQELIPQNGIFAAVVMSRFCCWEALYFLLKGKPREAFRRLSRKPVAARLGESAGVATWYYSPAEFRKLMGSGFGHTQSTVVYPVGFWLPPSYLNPFFNKYPRFLRLLNFLEKHCTPAWLAPMADHFFICFQLTPQGCVKSL